jgi:hypothetical protein
MKTTVFIVCCFFQHGMTALSIAQRLGYISVVEELKVVTETTIASKHEMITEERYKVDQRIRHDQSINQSIDRSFVRSSALDSSARSLA